MRCFRIVLVAAARLCIQHLDELPFLLPWYLCILVFREEVKGGLFDGFHKLLFLKGSMRNDCSLDCLPILAPCQADEERQLMQGSALLRMLVLLQHLASLSTIACAHVCSMRHNTHKLNWPFQYTFAQ